jgi:ABC-2 type transport system permease protein
VLAAPVGRTRWFLSVFSVTVAGAALLLVVAGLSLGVAVAVTLEEPRRALTVAGAVLVYLPAVVVLTGVAATFVGVGVRRFAVRDLG